MRRDTSDRRTARVSSAPVDALLAPRCPHAPASTGLPYGLRGWITGGLGALGLGLALSFSAGTAAAAPADGGAGGSASASSSGSGTGSAPNSDTTSGAGTGAATETRPSATTGPDRTASATGRVAPGRKGVRTVRVAGPRPRPVAELPSEPIESEPDDVTAPVDEPTSGGAVGSGAGAGTASETTAGNEKATPTTSSGRTAVTSASRSAAAKSTGDEQAEVSVAGPGARTVAAAAAAAPVAAATAASTPAIPGASALVNGRVVVGTIIVDILKGFGLPVPGQWARLLPIAVPSQLEVWWFTARRSIYGSPGAGPGDPDGPGDPGQLPLVWQTNFDSIEEAERYWSYQVGRWGASAGDNQYYTDGDNSYIDADGNLVIEARREATPDGAAAPYNYTSSRMVTLGKQSISVGQRVVARIQMPTDQGTVPAFWTLGIKPGDEYNFPSQGEIDIAEVAGHGTEESRRTWVGNLHGGAAWDEDVEIKMQGIGADLGVDLSEGFHEYGMDWHSDRIVWHIDGVEVARVTQQEWEAIGGDWTAFSGAYEHYLVLNIAVGNNWTGDPDPNEPFHSEMKVDWVKVYSLDNVTV